MEKTAIQVYTSCMVRKNLVASIFFMDFRSWVFRFFPLRLLLIFLLFFLSTAFLSAQEHLEGDWVRFALTGRAYMPEWGASSALESENPLLISRYDPGKALDEDPATAWVEGVPGPGSGEKYYIALPSLPEALGFINGYAKNRNLFEKNYRVKEFKVKVFAGLHVEGFSTEIAAFYDSLQISKTVIIRLEDTMEPQRVELPFNREEVLSRMKDFRRNQNTLPWVFPQAGEMNLRGSENIPVTFRYIIALEIADTYKGSTWQDTCIAELWPDYGEIREVTESDDSRSLMITTEDEETIAGYADFDYVLTLMEVSPDYKWAIVIREPAYVEAGERVTSEYAVIYLPGGRNVSSNFFDDPSLLGLTLLPTGFAEEEGRIYVEYEDFTSGESKRVLCSLY